MFGASLNVALHAPRCPSRSNTLDTANFRHVLNDLYSVSRVFCSSRFNGVEMFSWCLKGTAESELGCMRGRKKLERVSCCGTNPVGFS